MKLLYIVYFNAPMGGLHENVYSSALYMKKQKCDVYVALKPGKLQERLESHGVKTIITDFSDTEETVEKIEETGVRFDLLHFHPGKSKHSALAYGKKHKIPMVETFHGMWHDKLRDYIDQLNAVVTVSEGIKENLQNRVKKHYEKYMVVPNGYDKKLFNKPRFYRGNSNEINIGFITRLDKDKQFIIDILLLMVNHIKNKSEIKINIHIIGDGTLKDEFLDTCNSILEGSVHTIEFKGWLVDKKLKKAYLNCDIIVAPGRAAIEGMVSGKPVIAVGSKKYIGLIKHDNWQKGVYNNFGGYGKKFQDYEEGSVEDDLDILIGDKKNIELIGRFSHEIATQHFNADMINAKLYTLYRNIILSGEIEKRLTNMT